MSEVVQYGICVLLAGLLIYELARGRTGPYLVYFRALRVMMFAESVLVLAVVASVGVSLAMLLPFLDRSWLYRFPIVSGGQGINLNVLPLTMKFVGPAYAILFGLSLPAVAHYEEMEYRRDTRGWPHGIARSFRFGLSHCWVGIPLFAGIALSVGGIWFTYQYFKGGVARSTAYHLAYNLIILGTLATLWIAGSFR